jgi:hypothetical protein
VILWAAATRSFQIRSQLIPRLGALRIRNGLAFDLLQLPVVNCLREFLHIASKLDASQPFIKILHFPDQQFQHLLMRQSARVGVPGPSPAICATSFSKERAPFL